MMAAGGANGDLPVEGALRSCPRRGLAELAAADAESLRGKVVLVDLDLFLHQLPTRCPT